MNFKRSSIALLTAIYITVNVFGSLAFVTPVKAGSPVVDTALATLTSGLKIKDTVSAKITKGLVMSAMGALLNATSYFLRKLSSDTATFIASGGKGQGALIFKDGIGEYMKNTALDTVGEAVGTLGEPFGLNLCQIPDPKLDINLRVHYRNMFPTEGAPQPKCSWKQLEGSWGNIGNIMEKRYGPGGSRFVSETFSANLSASESDFGIALTGASQLTQLFEESKEVAKMKRTVTNGIKNVESKISGRTVTPAASIQTALEGLSPTEQAKTTAGQIAGLYSSQMEALPAMAASVFLNTLVSSLLNNVMTGLFSDTPDSKGGGLAKSAGNFFASSLKSSRKSAERVFSYLTAPSITQIDNYKIVDQLLVQKTIDTGLQQAVNRGNNLDTTLTIGEAAELNFLHRNWALIPPTHQWNSSVDSDCHLKGYCYSNLQKIRKARILPVGFELAALQSDPDEPWTLGKVIDGFDDCNQFGEADAQHPFCHLIDPNWVLKAPEARCKTEAIGPELIEDGINKRQAECMDLETCIFKNDDGTCNAWGYCTKEENTWRLGGESCPSYYSTCTTYQNTATNQASSYLARTVNFGQCDFESVGCQAYSSEQSKDAQGNWQWNTALTVDGNYKAFGRNQMIYFNRNVETCSASAEGCTAFYGAQRNPNTGIFNQTNNRYIRDSANLIHLKKAPDYLSCYDVNPANGLIIDWPQSKTEVLAKVAGNDTRCNDFAQVCAPEETGCSRFSPADGGNSITAIVDINSSCSAECVGYESFKQEESSFETGKFPLYFIPNNGKSCSVRSVGCSEFTNLSSSAGGESLVYYSDVRLCEKPDSIDEATFFSWEGSESEGFVLRNHLLKTMNGTDNTNINNFGLSYVGTDSASGVFPVGSPFYGNFTASAIQKNYNTCNEASYNLLISDIFAVGAADADCRQLYDSAGNIFYRILRETVVIDASCERLRKTEANLFVDFSIQDATSCGVQGGNWDNNTCQRCYGGGRFAGGSCLYEALPSQSTTCSAADNGCRAYTGNAGNNVKPDIILHKFEEGDPTISMANWSPSGIAISAESLQTGQHSLKVSANVVSRNIPIGLSSRDTSLDENGWYTLSFWARGASKNLLIYFEQQGQRYGVFTSASRDPLAPFADNPITIGNDWQEYRLGPTQFTGDGENDVLIKIEVAAGAASAGDYFIDNFSLSQVESSIYLVKDSWKKSVEFDTDNNPTTPAEQILADAPLSCYQGLDPRSPLPGAALGCREYKDASRNTYYLTGFSSLCREAAVGCQPMFDSSNTLGEILPAVYNLVCTGTANSQCTLGPIFGTSATCFIPPGETKCHVDKMLLPINTSKTPNEYTLLSDIPPAWIDVSTVYIPPENNDPLYLTNVAKYQCDSAQRGCTLLGLQDQTVSTMATTSFAYADTYILNNPENYGSTLCRQDLIGCNEYTAGNNVYYFKDPAKNGNAACSYKENVDGFSGWFKNDVGACSNDSTILCKTDTDCGGNNTCDNIGALACYSDYVQEGNFYNIWSNKSTNYEGLAGVCEQGFNACTEFTDPADTTNFNPDGKPYYRIFDNRLTSKLSECEGQVSLKEGCVLFNKTDQPAKLYSTEDTYRASDSAAPRFSPVNPKSDPAKNDANIILKVDRDRECSEWLACRNSQVIQDAKGKKQVLCSKYQACDRLPVGQQNEREGCTNFIEPVYGDTLLSAEKYVDRDVSWFGFDYSGYSILEKHQVSSFEYFTFSGDDTQYLGVSSQNPLAGNTCISGAGTDVTGDVCDVTENGRCFGGKCIFKLDSSAFPEVTKDDPATPAVESDTREIKIEKMRSGLLPASCKAYPEEDAPFPRSIAAPAFGEADILGQEGQQSITKINSGLTAQRTEFVVSNDKFSGVNVCQDNAADCSCSYKKYKYGDSNVVDYYSTSSSTSDKFAPKGVCIGGDKSGQPCEKDDHCIVKGEDDKIESAGSCSKLKQIDTKIGFFGFCLEPDLSRPINGKATSSGNQEYACQTWLPIQTSASNMDLFNMNISAGYVPELDADKTSVSGEMYCANSLQGGIVDTSTDLVIPARSLDLTQDKVDAGDYSSTVVSKLFKEPFYHYDCRGNSSPGCGGISCGVNFLIGALIGSLFGPIGTLVGGNAGLDIKNVSSSNYDTTIGAAFYHLICLQYPSVMDATKPNTGPPEEPLMSSTQKTNYIDNLQSTVYESLQAWTWNTIGPNAVVVRAEYGVNDQAGMADTQTSNVHTYVSTDGKISGLNGIYEFKNYENFINEDNIKNIYFIPLNLKGTMRGIIPRQINTLSKTDPLTDDDEYLKLPIAEMKKKDKDGKDGGIGDRPNGHMKAFQSAYIRHTRDCFAGVSGNCSNQYMPTRVINFTGDPSDFVANVSNNPGSSFFQFTYNVPLKMEQSPLRSSSACTKDNKTEPLLVWRYKINNQGSLAKTKPLFEAGVATKYVLSWFANNTDKVRYAESFNTCNASNVSYDTDTPEFITSLTSTNTTDESSERVREPGKNSTLDPFETTCATGFIKPVNEPSNLDNIQYDSPNNNPWFAIAVNFDSDGNFKGFTTKWCDGLGGVAYGTSITDPTGYTSHWSTPNGGMNYAVIVELENQCTEFVRVQDSNNAVGIKNKAWTNRVWRYSQNADGSPLLHPFQHTTSGSRGYGKDFVSGKIVLHRNTFKWNFGSTSLDELAILDVSANSPMLKYYLEDPKLDGIPYACDQTLSNGNINNVNISSIKKCGFPNTSEYRKTFNITRESDKPMNFDGPSLLDMLSTSFSVKKTISDARLAIFNLFAALFSDKQVSTVGTGMFKNILNIPGDDVSSLSGFYGATLPTSAGKIEYLLPPRIFSINPFTCPLGESGGNCSAGDADNITVNQVNGVVKNYNGIPGLDTDELAQKNDIIGQGTVEADVRFFAYADDNRMPIRKVTVNWGDGGDITNVTKEGYYKNSKPFCSAESKPTKLMSLCQMNDFGILLPSSLTCNTDTDCPIELLGQNSAPNCLSEAELKAGAVSGQNTYDTPRFGNTPRACTDVPFEFVHSYTCGSSSVKRSVDQVENPDTKARLTGEFGLSLGDLVCVYKPKVQVIDNWGYCNGNCPDANLDGNAGNDPLAGNYCYSANNFAKNDSSSPVGECKWSTALQVQGQTPYTEYKGNIIVIPTQP